MSDSTSTPAGGAAAPAGGAAAAATTQTPADGAAAAPDAAAAAAAAAAGGATGPAAPSTTVVGDAVAGEPKLGPDGKPLPTEPKLGPDGKPLPEGEGEPVVYTDFELPEGLAAEGPALTAFKETASKLGIPQDKAQTLLSEVGKHVAADAKQRADAQMQTWADTNKAWETEIKADPAFAGVKFDKMRNDVARLFDDIVGPVTDPARKALNEALLHTGAGNNPSIVRLLAKIADAHTEGGFVSGSPSRGPVDRAALLYPTAGQPSRAPGTQG